MVDKQIIIDGVDVADCEHINACDKKMKCVILQDDVCETNPYCEGFNCYYKQLKRKEQECERLRFPMPDTNYAILTKEEFEQLKGIIKKYEECNKYLVEENGKTYTRLEYKLLKTLTEIKEIAKNGCYDDCGMPLDELSIILQKISEVIPNEKV